MRVLYPLLQWTWGFVQTVVGGILTLLLIRYPHFRWRNAVVTRWPLGGSMSLGMFLFLGRVLPDGASPEAVARQEQRVLVHEYGHTIQSLILGPLYLLVVGLPSILWANLPALVRLRRRRHISYYRMYQEAWANSLGTRVTGLDAPEQNA